MIAQRSQPAMPAAEFSTVYTEQLNRNVFSHVLKLSTETSVDHIAAVLKYLQNKVKTV